MKDKWRLKNQSHPGEYRTLAGLRPADARVSNGHLQRVHIGGVSLSRDLDPGKIEANLSNGVLKLTIPKVEAAKPRRIEVRVG